MTATESQLCTPLQVKRLSPNAKLPERASADVAGYDLFASPSICIPAKGKALVLTDISISIPRGCYARIAPRSGLAHKHFIDVGAGVIDEDYRGAVGVICLILESIIFTFAKEIGLLD